MDVPYNSPWVDERTIPAGVAFISSVVVATSLLQEYRKQARSLHYEPIVTSAELETLNEDIDMPKTINPVLAFRGVQLLAAMGNCILTLSTAEGGGTVYSMLAFASGYAALLALVALLYPHAKCAFSIHTATILAVSFAVHGYRDIWPCLTFAMKARDSVEGWALWVRIGLSGLGGIAVPLLEPRIVVTREGAEEENKVSPVSFITFSFLDSIILAASKVSHLSTEQLPVLPAENHADLLAKRSIPLLDPFAGASTNVGITRKFFSIFRWSLVIQAILLALNSVAEIISPIGTNRLLNYLENGATEASVRPIVWIAWLALGPIIVSLSKEMSAYVSTQMLVKIESIVTSLVFDHSVRMRVSSQVQAKSSAKGTSTTDASSFSEEAGASTSVDEVDNAKMFSSKEESNTGQTTGLVNNLVTVDLQNISEARDFLNIVVRIPLIFTFSMLFLWKILGWSAIVGMVTMFSMLPVPARVASKLQGAQIKKMAATDIRVKDITESMSMIRIIKLFAMERLVTHDISLKREDELKWIWQSKVYQLFNNLINHAVPLFHLVATYACFTLVQKEPLTASIVYSSLALFELIRSLSFEMFMILPSIIQARVSLARLESFLSKTELLDRFSVNEVHKVEDPSKDSNCVGFSNARFTWTSAQTSAPGVFRLRIDGQVFFEQGSINIVVGPTGSGKTSVLMALLGEMHFIAGDTSSWYHLPRNNNGIAYVAQESWVLNMTIKENILFNLPFDESRYKEVLYQCRLERDLELLKFGDTTEVGEGGVTLSGGQKARITLARAVYSRASILLLDDVLAALDTSTARWIVEKCFNGKLLYGRTVILVTHHTALLAPLAKRVISVTNGEVTSKSSLIEAISQNRFLVEELGYKDPKVEVDVTGEPSIAFNADTAPDKVQLIATEETAIGSTSWDAVWLFIGSMTKSWSITFWLVYVTGCWGSQIALDAESWWLGWWAQQYLQRSQTNISVPFYLGIFVLIVVGSIVTHSWAVLMYTWGSVQASRSIHKQLVTSIFGATFRWLDTTPVSRIIARCTQDIALVDGSYAQNLDWFMNIILSMTTHLTAIMLFSPMFAFPSLCIGVVGWSCGQLYMRAQLPIKREMSNAKAPVLAVISAAISSGLVSMRAYGAQSKFREELHSRQDKLMTYTVSFYNLNRWLSVRMDFLSAIFSSSLAAYLVYGPSSISPSNVGFSLSRAILFSRSILYLVHLYNQLEVEGNSLERILGYMRIDQESKPIKAGIPPAYWPSSGDLRVEKLSAQYSKDGSYVLRDITFHIHSGERVGIVGRTGSGKSSLTLALLRCIPTAGEVYYDDQSTRSINLEALRSNVTIIPQIPELLGGTVRKNLDILGEYDDATLNDTLQSAGLSSIQNDANYPTITLDTHVSSGGSNLSVGQRQIIALARAMIRRSKILILDEATSAIDNDTDAVIQSSLRSKLGSDVTILCVAHRLQTIMDYDKILVLDAGQLVEFASPQELLKNQHGVFRELVNQSSDRQILYTLAGMTPP